MTTSPPRPYLAPTSPPRGGFGPFVTSPLAPPYRGEVTNTILGWFESRKNAMTSPLRKVST